MNNSIKNNGGLLDSVSSLDSLASLERKLRDGNAKINQLAFTIESSGSKIGELEGNFFGIVSAEKIKDQLTDLNQQISKSLGQIATSLRENNGNMQCMTNLIKTLVMVQADIYNQIGSATGSIVQIDDLVCEWCKKAQITDENLKEFIKISISHANKMRTFNCEVRSEFTQLTGRFKYIENFVLPLENNLNKYLNEAKKETEKIYLQIREYFSAIQTEMQRLAEQSQKNINSIKENLSAKNAALEAEQLKISELISRLNERHSVLFAQVEEKNNQIDKEIIVFNTKLQETENRLLEELSFKTESLMNDLCIKLGEMNQTLIEKATEYNCYKKRVKKWAIGGTVSIIGISTIINMILNLLMH
ncbi:hypothetical protein Barb4_00172 [Bacteroidales bacterium Barb4]|nr:hypothetical protein Barb4_00172 [Bacteroidales bacterium Barb4]